MRIRNLIFLTILLTILPGNETIAQTDENKFTPSGKPVILVFANYSSFINKAGNSGAFELARAYLGYEHNFSENFSSKLIFDVGDPGVGGLQMTAFVKNALLMYKKNDLVARIGMIGTDQFNVQEKHWGYRYLYKSFGDAYSLGSSADLGAGIEYSPAEFVSFDASFLNGEGYKKLQSDSAFKGSLGITLLPLEGLVVRAYYDLMNKVFTQSTFVIFTGYTSGSFRAGLEYNFQSNNRMRENQDLSGISTWAAFNLSEKFSLFARYDNLWSEKIGSEQLPWNNANDGELFLAGIDYSPVKGVKIAPVWSGWSPADKSQGFTTRIGLNLEIKY